MHRLPRAAALAACAFLTLSACSSSGSSAPSAAGKDGKGGKDSTSSGSASAKATPSRSDTAGGAAGGTGPAQAVTSKVEVSIKSCQLRDASKLFAVIQLNNAKGTADYAYTVKVRFLNPAHPDQAVYTTLAHQPVPVGVM